MSRSSKTLAAILALGAGVGLPLAAVLGGRVAPCALGRARALVGLAEGAPRFDAAVGRYWQRGYGTTCAVVANAVLSACGVPDELLNRGPGHQPGNHIAPLYAAAARVGALKLSPHVATLRPGDLYYVERDGDPASWHAGFVEAVQAGGVVTIDGGQRIGGKEAVARVRRPVSGALIGPAPMRRLKWAIDTQALITATKRAR